jgi:hypothetical protein
MPAAASWSPSCCTPSSSVATASSSRCGDSWVATARSQAWMTGSTPRHGQDLLDREGSVEFGEHRSGIELGRLRSAAARWDAGRRPGRRRRGGCRPCSSAWVWRAASMVWPVSSRADQSAHRVGALPGGCGHSSESAGSRRGSPTRPCLPPLAASTLTRYQTSPIPLATKSSERTMTNDEQSCQECPLDNFSRTPMH